MSTPPETDLEAKQILEKDNNNPIVSGKLASTDGSLLGILISLKNGKKDRSFYLGSP